MYLINLPKNDLKWLQKGLNKKDFREQCKTILVKNGYAYATNGHVMFKVETTEDLDGTYSFEGIKIEDIKHPLDNRDVSEGIDIEVSSLRLMTYNLNVLELNDKIGIDKSYFETAIDKSKQVDICRDVEGTKIKLRYSNRVAVIMGMKL